MATSIATLSRRRLGPDGPAFEAVLAKLSHVYYITWPGHYAAGHGYRHSALAVYNSSHGREIRIVVEPFARQTHRWTEADERIGRLRHGRMTPQSKMFWDLSSNEDCLMPTLG